ncbi:imidazole glycerol phosphate synthase subunit HisH [Litorimonas sp. RW-G-Af-16]|uniref:imidazole glycerol phosphate synthase subunit HisH n=1 Tax=Litorimonas sp. RW-G-Af-16 TaxID=3241168 RepID=UPI00390C58ED
MSLVIVDTGCANLSSVMFAFERLGVAAIISDSAKEIKAADRVIFPGVGSAPYAMAQIRSKGLASIMAELTQPVLGICLGMQLMFETLEEGGETVEGLGLIPAQITALDTGKLPSPHMGWNDLTLLRPDPLLKNIAEGDYAYFVHSFAAATGEYTLASCEYGQPFSAIIRHKNVWGCQFHPERSAKTGAQILKNFAEITL